MPKWFASSCPFSCLNSQQKWGSEHWKLQTFETFSNLFCCGLITLKGLLDGDMMQLLGDKSVCGYSLSFCCSFRRILIVGVASCLIMSRTYTLIALIIFLGIFRRTLPQQPLEKPKRDYKNTFLHNTSFSGELPCFNERFSEKGLVWSESVQMGWEMLHKNRHNNWVFVVSLHVPFTELYDLTIS